MSKSALRRMCRLPSELDAAALIALPLGVWVASESCVGENGAQVAVACGVQGTSVSAVWRRGHLHSCVVDGCKQDIDILAGEV